jgi:hypothetical protein
MVEYAKCMLAVVSARCAELIENGLLLLLRATEIAYTDGGNVLAF